MKKYLQVYKTLLMMNLSVLFMYPANFYNSLIASIAWGLFSLFSIVLLTSKTTLVFGWRREELLLLNGLYGIIVGIYHVFLSRNFERFSTIVHFGQLDSILIKPIDTQFLLSFWLVGYATISRVIIAALYTWYIAGQLHMTPTLLQIVGIVILMIFSLLLLYSIWYSVITLTIWQSRLSNLTELMFTITGSARYPQEMTHQLASYIFVFLLPLTLIVNIPAKVVLNRVQSADVIWLLLLAIIFFILSRKFWKFALRYYSSASS